MNNHAPGATIRRLSAADARSVQHRLAAILQDAVHNGASVGYLAPLVEEEALAYWSSVIAALDGPHRILLVAEVAGEIAGTVQLVLEPRPNSTHRAEVSKLLVHSTYQRRGIGAMLMRRVEGEAHAADRSLLVLDTQTGEAAERLYRMVGYVRTGVVPNYARFPDGRLGATSFMYKWLDTVPSQ
jgi:acetyltransferase